MSTWTMLLCVGGTISVLVVVFGVFLPLVNRLEGYLDHAPEWQGALYAFVVVGIVVAGIAMGRIPRLAILERGAVDG